MQIFSDQQIKMALLSEPNITIIGLHGNGDEIKPSKEKIGKKGEKLYPLVVIASAWTEEQQLESAETWKDKIQRVFDPASIPADKAVMLQDDIRRIGITEKFNYGKKVLELGCSDGTVSMHIARNKAVKRIFGVDIRQSAIDDAEKLKKELLAKGFFGQEEMEKLSFIRSSGGMERLKERVPMMDTVCALEVLEHIHPYDMLEVFEGLYSLLKEDGNMFVSVPNRYPNDKYTKEKRHRWPWFDHKNFFSKLSLELFLKEYFKEVRFIPLYDGEKTHEGIYLICECRGKKK